MYQSQYTGEEIDESIGKVQDVFVKKTSILPVEIGGTGQTTIDGLKNMLGIGQGQDILPIANGGTGATTAADARSNLGVTPGNIGAAPASEHNMKTYTSLGQIGLSGAPTMDEIQQALPNSSRLVFTPSTSAYTEGTGTANIPSLFGMVVMEKINPSRWDISFRSKTGSNELWVGTKGDDSGSTAVFNQWVKIPSTATLASDIQSLLQGGSISVVKSIQRGKQAISGNESSTITINAVNVNKAFVIINQEAQTGERSSDSGTYEYGIAGAYLNSSTSLIIENFRSDSSAIVLWQVVEFY